MSLRTTPEHDSRRYEETAMASSDVPTMRGTEGLRVTEDRGSRKDFVQGATAGGLLRGLALGAILSRVAQGYGGARRRQR